MGSDAAERARGRRRERDLEAIARKARQEFGDGIPEGLLDEEEIAVYERLYGTPYIIEAGDEGEEGGVEEWAEGEAGEAEDSAEKYVLLKDGEGGELEEVEFAVSGEGGDAEMARARALAEHMAKNGDEEMAEALRELDAAERALKGKESGELDSDIEAYHEEDLEDLEDDPAYLSEGDEPYEEDTYDTGSVTRTHPLTAAGRFSTFPSTLSLPRTALLDPLTTMLSSAHTNPKHLADTAHRVFGGPALPHSTASLNKRQKGTGVAQQPVALAAGQPQMTDIEAAAYCAAVMPGTYAGLTSALVEVRRRLGAKWVEGLLEKEGGPTVLDAGAGGAGVVAWREVLRAEWERMHEDKELEGEEGSEDTSLRGPPPLGKATVLTGPAALRHRASRFLENTSFLPRLPEHVSPAETAASTAAAAAAAGNEAPTGTQDDASKEASNVKGQKAQPRKLYDVILAPHSLWPIQEDYLRKAHVQTLWSLLNPNGGVLILLEKGLPRGFEAIAGARKLLLDKHIAAPGEETDLAKVEEEARRTGTLADLKGPAKEVGMVVAPCTNHEACPMYKVHGPAIGRKDFCSFKQRYFRPGFLQRILGAGLPGEGRPSRNHEDVAFSYVAVRRGRDARRAKHDEVFGMGFEQGDKAADEAFEGFGKEEVQEVEEAVEAVRSETSAEDNENKPTPPPPSTPNPLALPRTIDRPIKRQGHVMIDVCTPAGKLERWTVPRSFGKQAYRDARKARWGDLWALGAKTRVPRNVRLGREQRRGELQGGASAAEKESRRKRKPKYNVVVDRESGRVSLGGGGKVHEARKDVKGSKKAERKARAERTEMEREFSGQGVGWGNAEKEYDELMRGL
ncbi:mitochondrial small ribosomal subunit Rsm22-domain-containing protein [Lineolata rhizophorae]|uniref:Mitochondrial small ribosomal subunit Rsm22-domain-containing protein n=1 Tax=Lineolata rhizophorae TaxID=578093 RepID=A0A6A6P9T7_9PEZI|nr:mitochondrial small ribosomal subunit Rsm22-domain-containing protein [Lineolata rhizophorae]